MPLNWSLRDPEALALQDAAVDAWLTEHEGGGAEGSERPSGGSIATWFRDSGIGEDCLGELENLHSTDELDQFLAAVAQYAADGVDVGAAMALDGLASSPELNGQMVTVLAYLVERGRYQCEILDGGRQLAVKAGRLRALSEAEAGAAAGLQRAAAEAEAAAMAGLAEALEAEEEAAAAGGGGGGGDSGTTITGGDVDWAAVDAGTGGPAAPAPAPESMEAGERLRYEIRYTLQVRGTPLLALPLPSCQKLMPLLVLLLQPPDPEPVSDHGP